MDTVLTRAPAGNPGQIVLSPPIPVLRPVTQQVRQLNPEAWLPRPRKPETESLLPPINDLRLDDDFGLPVFEDAANRVLEYADTGKLRDAICEWIDAPNSGNAQRAVLTALLVDTKQALAELARKQVWA